MIKDIIDGNLYFIKDQYFIDFPDPNFRVRDIGAA